MLEDLLTELETFADDFRQPRIEEIVDEIRNLLLNSTVQLSTEPEAP
jgi:hypothetical protein